MKHFYFLAFAVLLIDFSSYAYAQSNTVSLTSYYPVPFGAYDSLRLVPRADLTGACTNGSFYFRSSDNTLQFCANSVWGPLSGLWAMTAQSAGFDPDQPSIRVNQYYPSGSYGDLTVRKPYVGIGTNNPKSPLHITINNNSSPPPTALMIENLGTTPGLGGTISFAGVEGGVPTTKYVNLQATYQDLSAAAARSSFSILLRDGSTGAMVEQFTFQGNGFLGVRDTSPDAVAEFAGNAAAAGANTLPYLMISTNSTEANSGNVMTIDSTGRVGINQQTPTEKLEVVGNIKATNLILTSDAKLKKNIVPLNNALEKVSRLKGVSFEWKDNLQQTDQRKHMGVIAQDVEKVFPEAVCGKDGAKGVDYPALIAPLLEAVKELKAQNETLNHQREEQAARIYEQQQRIDLLENSCAAKEPGFTP